MTTMPDEITGGVDTHLDVHVAAALNAIGGLLGVESFPADGPWALKSRRWCRGADPWARPGHADGRRVDATSALDRWRGDDRP